MSRLFLLSDVSEGVGFDPKTPYLPVPTLLGLNDFSYIARVKAYLQDARDLVSSSRRFQRHCRDKSGSQ